MLFIECEGHNTYINVERIESIYTMMNLLRCTTTSGEEYTLYTADKKKIDYLKTKLVEDIARRSQMIGIIDLESLAF